MKRVLSLLTVSVFSCIQYGYGSTGMECWLKEVRGHLLHNISKQQKSVSPKYKSDTAARWEKSQAAKADIRLICDTNKPLLYR